MHADEGHLAIDHAKRRPQSFEGIVIFGIESIGQPSIAQKRPQSGRSFGSSRGRDRQFEGNALIVAFGFLAHEHEFVPGFDRTPK